jgi:hypothetical protein
LAEVKHYMRHSTKKLELTGQKYGKLTVIGPAQNIGSRTAWRCQCECGKETIVKTNCLRSGHTTSCGCMSPGGTPGKGPLGLTYIEGTCVQMLQAKTIRCNNTSGVTGVDWMPGKHRWRAMICFKGRRHYLGSYTNFEDAVKVRRQAEHDLHDEFLRKFAKSMKES